LFIRGRFGSLHVIGWLERLLVERFSGNPGGLSRGKEENRAIPTSLFSLSPPSLPQPLRSTVHIFSVRNHHTLPSKLISLDRLVLIDALRKALINFDL